MYNLRSTKWLSDIKIGSIPVTSADDFASNVKIVKGAESGIKNIDDVFSTLPMSLEGDDIIINGKKSFREVHPKFRRGEFNSAFSDVDIKTSITNSDESTFRKALAKDAPDIDVQEIDKNIELAKKQHEDLNVNAKDGAELESKLTPKAKEKAKSMYQKIAKVVGVGAVAAGVFTAFLISEKVFDDLADATNNRNGCFIVYKNTDTVACKLLARSCGFGDAGAVTCSTDIVNKTMYNIRLMVLDVINTADTKFIENVNVAGGDWQNGYTADDVLSKPVNIPILLNFYPEKYPTVDSITFNPCELGGIIKGCVACNSSLPTNDINYCSSETLDANMIYKCITDSTIIDTLTDIATNLGIDLFNASGDSLSGSLQGNFFMGLIIILIIIIVGALLIKFLPRKNKVTERSTVSERDVSDHVTPNNNTNTNQQLEAPPTNEIVY